MATEIHKPAYSKTPSHPPPSPSRITRIRVRGRAAAAAMHPYFSSPDSPSHAPSPRSDSK